MLVAVTDPHSGQPESKQAAVAIAAWQPAWHSELFAANRCHFLRPGTGGGGRRRRAALLAGREASARQWLRVWCEQRGWQLQVADGGAVWNLLAWHQGG
jgi:assimilatory nitrate reductase catalytic subunit